MKSLRVSRQFPVLPAGFMYAAKVLDVPGVLGPTVALKKKSAERAEKVSHQKTGCRTSRCFFMAGSTESLHPTPGLGQNAE
jgi:hypothetical protein